MLFIGGSQDGKYIEVPDRTNIWRIAKPRKVLVSACVGIKVPTSAPDGPEEVYRKVDISLCEMMVIDYLSVGEIVPRLMGGYRPEVKEEG